MQIRIPSLIRILFQEVGNKNKILQVLEPAIEIPLSITRKDAKSITIEHNGREYYFTKLGNTAPATQRYALQTDIAPSKVAFESGKVTIKKWLRHQTTSEYTVDEVIQSWENQFSFKEEDSGNSILGLRQPQIGALYMILGHLNLPSDTGTVVLPTGTGKTETMLSTLIAHRCKKVLVTVPSDSLRSQIASKFLTLGLLKEFEIVGKQAKFPIVGIIKEGFKDIEALKTFFESCNVIVTTMSILTGCSDEEQKMIADLCSHVFIDEAHHVKAASWSTFKSKFPAHKVLQFTATPFRNDGERLEGKIIYNFPLKAAQNQGYFKKIDFISIREYDSEKGDEKIAEIAVKRLREDLLRYNHILMARCETKERAEQIFKLYEVHTDLNPVLIYSGISNKQERYRKILSKEAKIIVCVDMLGEGFDLPELKIAAFHDIRKSLPITLQFAGRFTRTKYDEQLGNASFIANIANVDVKKELAELYAGDTDWNEILPAISYSKIKNEIDFSTLIQGFSGKEAIPFQNIRPKLSSVVYKNKTTEWFPTNFAKGIPGYENLEHSFYDINHDHKILVIITAKREDVFWINHKEINVLNWHLTVVFWETKNNLLFINSSDNSSLYQELAYAIIGEKAELIKGIDVFKAFSGIKRTKLQNVGLRYFLGKSERFRMSVGSDIAEALSIAERQKGEKAFVMGVGFENGEPVNIGASYKGRIWTKSEDDLMEFKTWCTHIGKKLSDANIDPNQVLKETLIPEQRFVIPNLYPVWIDWDVEMYMTAETKFTFIIDGFSYNMSKAELRLENPTPGGPLVFSIITDYKKATFELQLFENTLDPDNKFADFKIHQIGKEIVEVQYGTRTTTAIKFFEEYIPTVWFADGSALTGNEYVQLKHTIVAYPRDEIIAWDWEGVNLSVESQGVLPKVTDSIQYKVIEELKKDYFDIIYDDDYSGEIADVIAMKLLPDKIKVNLYHLKYALGGKVTGQVKNLYEVCGQAQKSIHWKHKDGKEFIDHLLRRENKTLSGNSCSRIERGTIKDIEKLLKIAKQEIPIEFEIYIVQPGFSKKDATVEILTLLSVTEKYIKDVAGINLKVIAST